MTWGGARKQYVAHCTTAFKPLFILHIQPMLIILQGLITADDHICGPFTAVQWVCSSFE
jgi:hypothetical protein